MGRRSERVARRIAGGGVVKDFGGGVEGEAGFGRAGEEDGGGDDAGMGVEAGFDFVEFDPVAAEFDLAVAAAEKVEAAVGAAADEVAGAVEAVGSEGGLVEVGAVPVALHEGGGADEEFVVDDPDVSFGPGGADGEGGVCLGWGVEVVDGADVGFGGAVEVAEPGVGDVGG